MKPVSYKRIIVKIGSNVLAGKDSLLDTERIRNICDQVHRIKQSGTEVVLVSSGAVASGRSLVRLPDNYDVVSRRQVLASVGQVRLINTYSEMFSRFNLLCSQVLVTKEDFRDREHYLNMKNCLETLLKNNIVPVINENDVISVTELMFTDNDELAGLVASMLDADMLLLLTNVDGIYTGSPSDPASRIIHTVEYEKDILSDFITSEKSNFGRGGMITKCSIARKVAALGIPVHIANGTTEGIVEQVLRGKKSGTLFLPKKNASSAKKWIAHSESSAKGNVYIDEGARKALLSDKPTSLLPVGVKKITGSFKKGDIIRILDMKSNVIGIGKAQYNSGKANELKGKKNQKPVVHYDYLFLY